MPDRLAAAKAWIASSPIIAATAARLKQYDADRHRRYRKWRFREDAQFHLLSAMRTRMRSALKQRRKRGSTINLIGCSPRELVAHLEKQFLPGMTWENYGQWHVDHRKPCAAFDLTQYEDQFECFHFTNLQPLWAAENHRKGAKVLNLTK